MSVAGNPHTPLNPFRLRTYVDEGTESPVKSGKSITTSNYNALLPLMEKAVAEAKVETDTDKKRRWVVIEHVVTEVFIEPE